MELARAVSERNEAAKTPFGIHGDHRGAVVSIIGAFRSRLDGNGPVRSVTCSWGESLLKAVESWLFLFYVYDCNRGVTLIFYFMCLCRMHEWNFRFVE